MGFAHLGGKENIAPSVQIDKESLKPMDYHGINQCTDNNDKFSRISYILTCQIKG